MSNDPESREEVRSVRARGRPAVRAGWEPRFEVIPLDCEITAYAPDGDDPLF
jgi:hypothetical protein